MDTSNTLNPKLETTGAANASSTRSLTALFATKASLSPTVLRLVLALVMFPHGAQKLLGWFGGYGFGGTMDFFTGAMGLPWLVGFAVIVIEFFCPLLLLVGLGTRLAALGIGGVMTGVMIMVNSRHGFFMNWFGNQQGEGIEFALLAIGIAAALVMSGGGRFSLDREVAQEMDGQ